MIKFFWYPKCSTCRDAKKYLEEKGTKFEAVDIVEKPPSVAELKKVLRSEQYTMRQLFNTAGQVYREMKLAEKIEEMSEASLLKLLSENGKLVKRPFVTDGEHHVVGFDKKSFDKNF
jgi:arsenate reductase